VIWAKSNFGEVNYSSPGVGSSNHLFGAYFNRKRPGSTPLTRSW
jgi:hypothetical protein